MTISLVKYTKFLICVWSYWYAPLLLTSVKFVTQLSQHQTRLAMRLTKNWLYDQILHTVYKYHILSDMCFGVSDMPPCFRPWLWWWFQVRNVTDFGAFVDIGVHKNGLVHKSKMRSHKLTVGNQLEVRIVELDLNRGRISLELLKLLWSMIRKTSRN